jgi:putative flippase GtrA
VSSLALRARETGAQLGRFALVGGSGYAVNLAVFALATGAGAGHRTAAVLAFLVAVSSNFAWNRHWTFDAAGGHAGHQAARFLLVSTGAFLVSLLVLELLVGPGGLDDLLAQAVAVVAVTPLSFAGNRLWTFRS